MKKCIFTFMVSLLSVAMFATKATFDFTAKDDLGKACDLSKIVVENVTQGWTETLTGPDFSLELEEGSQGLEDVSASNGALSVIGTDPFTGSTQLSLNVAQTGDVYVSLIDLSGRVIYSQTQMLNAGSYVMNVNLPMPQLYYLIAETKSGVYSAKLLNQGIADNAEISIYPGVAQRVAAKQYGNHGYKDGDKIRFVGYAVISGKEYTVTVTITITIGMHKTIEFVFDTTSGNIKEKHTESGMYVGITGFGENVKYYPGENNRYGKLTKENKSNFISFINQMTISNGTALFYALDNNLSYLRYCSFPSDVINVSFITFTDGLDQGSRGVAMTKGQNDEYIKTTSSYLAAIKDKLSSTTMSSKDGRVKINAYAIGVRGGDIVTDEEVNMFKNNLKSMASSEENAFMAENMNQVNETFKKIAESLYKESRSITASIILPMPSENVKERFAFDQVKDGADSKCYLEGVYRNNALEEIKYVNCSSSSGTTVKQTMVGSKIKFEFEKFEVAEGYTFNPKKIINFKMEEGLSSWQKNKEFDPDEQPDIDIKRSSAVVMLNLDCSSSLIDEEEGIDVFKDVKTAAINFINLVASSTADDPGVTPGEDPEEKPESASTYYIKHSWGSGADEDWSWQPMTKDGTNYIYYGKWGGYGANINTKASDTGSKWFDAADMSGASSLSIGDGVKFTYNPTSATLSVDKTSNSSTTDRAKVRFQKQDAYANIYAMSIEEFVDQVWVGTFVEHDFGTSAETSSYYDIPAGKAYPMVNVGGEWYMALDEKQYHFGAGKKYTFSCGDDGTYYTYSITVDGTFNAPAKSQVVAQGRILKSELKKNAVLKK